MHDDQFTATGPSHHSSGQTKAAFSTVPPVDANSNLSDFEIGAHVNGRRFGVVGSSSKPPFPGLGIAGVHGEGHGCRFGVLGTATARAEVGVVGASVANTNEINNLNIPSEEATLEAGGDKIGVLGMSGTAPGVDGRSVTGVGVSALSREGVGVLARSEAGVSLHAVSEANRAGVFQSGGAFAQINLVPIEQERSRIALPKDGEVGDLIFVRNAHSDPEDPVSYKPECSLWLCVSDNLIAGAAVWKEVQLGPPVKGTL
jgi:hypothetical protein